MHVPDGFLDAQTSIGTGVLAAGVVAVSLRKARGELDDRTAPLAGLVAVFIFAGQMLNFPVGAGTSGAVASRRQRHQMKAANAPKTHHSTA